MTGGTPRSVQAKALDASFCNFHWPNVPSRHPRIGRNGPKINFKPPLLSNSQYSALSTCIRIYWIEQIRNEACCMRNQQNLEYINESNSLQKKNTLMRQDNTLRRWRTAIHASPRFTTERVFVTNKSKREERTENPSHINECVLEPEVPRVSSEIHPPAMLIIMPPERVIPSVDLLVASETYRSSSRILDMSFTLPAPTEVFPAGTTGPLSPDFLERTGLAADRFLRGQCWVLKFRGGYLGGWWRRGKREVVRETPMKMRSKELKNLQGLVTYEEGIVKSGAACSAM